MEARIEIVRGMPQMEDKGYIGRNKAGVSEITHMRQRAGPAESDGAPVAGAGGYARFKAFRELVR